MESAALFNKPCADVILRSSNNVDFSTYKGVLILASPFFEDMFQLPQPSSSAQDFHPHSGLPIIPVAESSLTLDRLLRLCYPVANPVFPSVSDVVEVLLAAQKYEMKEAISQLSQPLQKFSKSTSFSTYAVACRCGLKDVACDATRAYWKRNSNRESLSREPIQYVPEMDFMTAGALYRLLRFCYEARDAKEFVFYPETRRARSSAQSPSPLAPNPFDHPSTHSDTILESSDHVRFHVVGLQLVLASPVFAGLITQAPDGDATISEIDAPNVITVTENSEVLLWILHFCYPMLDPQIPSAALEDVLDAARKYDIARLTGFAKRMCVDLAWTNALRAYLIAVREDPRIWEGRPDHFPDESLRF